jgi:hypothetical protein
MTTFDDLRTTTYSDGNADGNATLMCVIYHVKTLPTRAVARGTEEDGLAIGGSRLKVRRYQARLPFRE